MIVQSTNLNLFTEGGRLFERSRSEATRVLVLVQLLLVLGVSEATPRFSIDKEYSKKARRSTEKNEDLVCQSADIVWKPAPICVSCRRLTV
jgi:hypothetical protein